MIGMPGCLLRPGLNQISLVPIAIRSSVHGRRTQLLAEQTVFMRNGVCSKLIRFSTWPVGPDPRLFNHYKIALETIILKPE